MGAIDTIIEENRKKWAIFSTQNSMFPNFGFAVMAREEFEKFLLKCQIAFWPCISHQQTLQWNRRNYSRIMSLRPPLRHGNVICLLSVMSDWSQYWNIVWLCGSDERNCRLPTPTPHFGRQPCWRKCIIYLFAGRLEHCGKWFDCRAALIGKWGYSRRLCVVVAPRACDSNMFRLFDTSFSSPPYIVPTQAATSRPVGRRVHATAAHVFAQNSFTTKFRSPLSLAIFFLFFSNVTHARINWPVLTHVQGT